MNATVNAPNTPAPVTTRTVIESNHMGGRWIDRLYKLGVTDAVELINKDSTLYRGKIYCRRITLQNNQDENFFAVAYESADGRWFDNCGLPMQEPKYSTKEDQPNI
jgi:hypothetical protein